MIEFKTSVPGFRRQVKSLMYEAVQAVSGSIGPNAGSAVMEDRVFILGKLRPALVFAMGYEEAYPASMVRDGILEYLAWNEWRLGPGSADFSVSRRRWCDVRKSMGFQ